MSLKKHISIEEKKKIAAAKNAALAANHTFSDDTVKRRCLI